MRYLRYFLTVLLILAVLTLIVVTAQFFFTTPERVGARLNHFLEVTAGLRLENPQPAELKRFPKLVATLPAGEIVDVKTGCALGAFDRAVFTLEPFALFAETPKIARIEVDGAVLEVPTERIRLPRSAQSSVTEPPTDEARVGNEELDRIEQPEKPGISSESDVFWTINEIELRDAEIRLSGAASSATLTGTRLVLRDFSENGATFQINTALIAGGFKGEFLGSTAVTRSKDGRLRATALSTAFSGLAFEEKTELSLAADSLVLANEGLEASNLSVRAQSADGLTLSATAPRARLTEADFAAVLRIDVQARVGEETLNFLASGSLEHAFGTGRTALSQLAIDTAPGNAAGAASRLTGSLEIDRTERSGAVALDGFFFGAPAELKARIALPGLSPSERPLLEGRIRTGEPTEHETALLGLFARAARHIDFKGTLDFTGLAADAQATAFQADVIAQAGRVTVSSRNAQCFSGETAFTATLAPDATWRAKAVIADGSAGSLFGVLGFSPVASGVLSGELVASGRISAETYLSKLEARGVVRTGVLKGFDLVKAVDILVADRPEETPPEVVKPEAATPFETLRFDVCLGCSSVDEAPAVEIKGEALGENWHAGFSGTRSALQTRFDVALGEDRPHVPLAAELKRSASPTAYVWTPDWQHAYAHVEEVLPSGFSIEGALRRFKRTLRDFWEGLEAPALPSFEESISTPNFELPTLPDNWRWPWEDDAPAQTAPSAPMAETNADPRSI